MHALSRLYTRLRTAGIEPGDSEELRLKKVVLLFACGLMIAAAAIWLALYQALGLPVSSSWPLAFQVASMVTLIYYLVTLNFDVFRAVQLGMFLFVPFAVQWSIGNFVSASGMILWGLLAPVGAVLLYSARESIPWIAAYIVLTLASGYVDYQLAWLPPKAPKVPLATSVVFFALNFAAMSTLVYALLRFAFVEREKSRVRLEEAHARLGEEQARSERLLLNVLPEPIAVRLKRMESPIADGFPEVTVMFADIVNFTRMAGVLEPAQIFSLLNRLFSAFDAAAEKLGLEKIKTIGDAYMVAGGLVPGQTGREAAIAELAFAMREITGREFALEGQPLKLRIGIASGPVVAGVVGTKKFIYDLWGDTVNIASRLTSESEPGRIQVDERTHGLLAGKYVFTAPRTLNLKGKGYTTVYELAGRADEGSAPVDGSASA
ncbi:MAG: adenylate/guanylate cyclase domain-containing protein [Proteobacteria bacterium]|nr:adenylate/guanylate cyclase domain-containing protein [Pseudomonadota bacterium]